MIQSLSPLLSAIMVATGYLDPANIATSIQAGSTFGFALLWVLFASNWIGILFQYIAMKVGLISNLNLAQLCRKSMPSWANKSMFVLFLIVVIATDISEVLGTAVALQLLAPFLPLWVAVLLTILDTFALFFVQDKNLRLFERLLIFLLLVVSLCFIVELFFAKPPFVSVIVGFIPTIPENSFILISALIGATIMPHNLLVGSANIADGAGDSLFSHTRNSSLVDDNPKLPNSISLQPFSPTNSSIVDLSSSCSVQENSQSSSEDIFETPISSSEDFNSESPQNSSIPQSQEYHQEIITSSKKILFIALNFAFSLNAAMLIIAASVFYPQGRVVDELDQAHDLLEILFNSEIAPVAFGIALLCSGQSSSFAGIFSSQLVIEGFLKISWPKWQLRLITRAISLFPSLLTVILLGEKGAQSLIILTQVVLSLQLPFALIPLLKFADTSCMDKLPFDKNTLKVAWVFAFLIIFFNIFLLSSMISEAFSGFEPSANPVRFGLFILLLLLALLGVSVLLYFLYWLLKFDYVIDHDESTDTLLGYETCSSSSSSSTNRRFSVSSDELNAQHSPPQFSELSSEPKREILNPIESFEELEHVQTMTDPFKEDIATLL